MSNLRLFTGNSNPLLAKKVAECLNLPLGKCIVSKFKDGEVRVKYLESVQGKDVVLLQSTCTPQDTNLMELLLLADGAFRNSARSITAVFPYLGYSRQDKCTPGEIEPISAKLIAKMLKAAGINRFVTINLHSDQTQGFFEMPVYNLYGHAFFIDEVVLKKKFFGVENLVIVSPDVGGIVRTRTFAEKVGSPHLAFINKRRARPNEAKVLDVIGNVKGKNCILIDDMIDTGGTLIAGAEALKKLGANTITAYCVHPVLSGDVARHIERSPLDELVVTDTIEYARPIVGHKKIRHYSVAPMIANTILKIFDLYPRTRSIKRPVYEYEMEAVI